MGAAVTALLCVGYTTYQHSSTSTSSSSWYDSNNVAPDAVDLLSHHHSHNDDGNLQLSKSHKGKKGGEKKHVLTKAEMNTQLFDDQREFLHYLHVHVYF